jgi:hypothetical protein
MYGRHAALLKHRSRQPYRDAPAADAIDRPNGVFSVAISAGGQAK